MRRKRTAEIAYARAEALELIVANTKRRLCLQYVCENGDELYCYVTERPFPIKRAHTGHWFFQHPACDYELGAVRPWKRFSKPTSQVLREARPHVIEKRKEYDHA